MRTHHSSPFLCWAKPLRKVVRCSPCVAGCFTGKALRLQPFVQHLDWSRCEWSLIFRRIYKHGTDVFSERHLAENWSLPPSTKREDNRSALEWLRLCGWRDCAHRWMVYSHVSVPVGFVNANRKPFLKVFGSQGSSSGRLLSKSPQNWLEFMHTLPWPKLQLLICRFFKCFKRFDGQNVLPFSLDRHVFQHVVVIFCPFSLQTTWKKRSCHTYFFFLQCKNQKNIQ